MLGAQALPYVSAIAMLNANYILTKLEPHYKILFVDRDASSESGTKHCAHEFILDLREFKRLALKPLMWLKITGLRIPCTNHVFPSCWNFDD